MTDWPRMPDDDTLLWRDELRVAVGAIVVLICVLAWTALS